MPIIRGRYLKWCVECEREVADVDDEIVFEGRVATKCWAALSDERCTANITCFAFYWFCTLIENLHAAGALSSAEKQGCEDGYLSGYESGLKDGQNVDHDAIYWAGFERGYEAGERDALK